MQIEFFYVESVLYWRYKILGDISGTSYDVATVRWGGGARMPTLEEIKELVYECNWEDGYLNNVAGEFVIGPNGNSIFIPFAGRRDGTELDSEGRYGYYWSEADSYDFFAYCLSLSLFHGWFGEWDDHCNREYGCSVRPVSD